MAPNTPEAGRCAPKLESCWVWACPLLMQLPWAEVTVATRELPCMVQARGWGSCLSLLQFSAVKLWPLKRVPGEAPSGGWVPAAQGGLCRPVALSSPAPCGGISDAVRSGADG